MAARGGSARARSGRYQREFESSRGVCWGKTFFDHDKFFSAGGKLGKKGILWGGWSDSVFFLDRVLTTRIASAEEERSSELRIKYFIVLTWMTRFFLHVEVACGPSHGFFLDGNFFRGVLWWVFRGKIQDGTARFSSRKKIRVFLLLVSLRYSQQSLDSGKKKSKQNKEWIFSWERRKCNILQKSRFPFGKIAHLPVLILKHILINGISCDKVVFFFARFCIY